MPDSMELVQSFPRPATEIDRLGAAAPVHPGGQVDGIFFPAGFQCGMCGCRAPDECHCS